MKERNGNLLDLLILLAVGFGVICAIGRGLEAQKKEEGTGIEAIVTVRVTATEAYLPSVVTVGEEVFLASGEKYGELLFVRSSPARAEVEHSGEILVGEWETGELWDAEVMLRIRGDAGENGFLREGGVSVLVGQKLSLYTERAYIYGTVSEVRASSP